MRTYPGVRPSQFRDPGERNQIKVIDDMLRQVTGALAGLEQTGQQPLSGIVGGGGSSAPLAHASTHGAAGTDPVTLAETQITDGALLARVADNESILGSWDFNSDSSHYLKVHSTFTGAPNDGLGLQIVDDTVPTSVKIEVAAVQSADGTCILPDCSGAEINLVANSNTVTLSNKTMGTGTKLRVNAAGASCIFQDVTSTTKQMGLDISAITAGSTRAYAGLNLSGTIPLVGNDPPAVAAGALGKVDSITQSADITTTNLTNAPPTGLYRVDAILMTTTGAAAAGTLTLTIGWTDNVGATTSTPIAAHSLVTTGRTAGSQLLRVSSGEITYAVAVTGIYSTAAYAVYVRVTALG
jgi:hypothetical protein